MSFVAYTYVEIMSGEMLNQPCMFMIIIFQVGCVILVLGMH